MDNYEKYVKLQFELEELTEKIRNRNEKRQKMGNDMQKVGLLFKKDRLMIKIGEIREVRDDPLSGHQKFLDIAPLYDEDEIFDFLHVDLEDRRRYRECVGEIAELKKKLKVTP